MAKVHFVYPHGPEISCPDAIGRNVASRLRSRYDVKLYRWDEARKIVPRDGDVLLGHPHPSPWTVFRRSLKQPGWRRIIALSPYSHGDTVQMAWADATIRRCDLFLAITGNHWFQSVEGSIFCHWAPKMRHVDLAVDRADFPTVKDEFNPPRDRKFVYIGHTLCFKNTSYLSEIVRADPSLRVSWMGRGRSTIEGLEALGPQDFSSEDSKRMLDKHDFLITVGRSDANPVTILEAMSWGLIPVCTRESGYQGFRSIVNVPLDDAESAAEVLSELQRMDASELTEMREQNWRLLDEHFNWDRFAAQIVDAIESKDSPSVVNTSVTQSLKIKWAIVASPYAFWRPRNLLRMAKTAVRNLARS